MLVVFGASHTKKSTTHDTQTQSTHRSAAIVEHVLHKLFAAKDARDDVGIALAAAGHGRLGELLQDRLDLGDARVEVGDALGAHDDAVALGREAAVNSEAVAAQIAVGVDAQHVLAARAAQLEAGVRAGVEVVVQEHQAQQLVGRVAVLMRALVDLEQEGVGAEKRCAARRAREASARVLCPSPTDGTQPRRTIRGLEKEARIVQAAA